jgi:fatty-acid desaturase
VQCGEPTNVGDLEKQSFYRFIRSTYMVHPFTFGVLLYAIGGFPFLVWGVVWKFLSFQYFCCFLIDSLITKQNLEKESITN